MKKEKSLFSTPKKAVLISGCIVFCLALLGTGTVFAAEAIAEKKTVGKTASESMALQDMGTTPEQAKEVALADAGVSAETAVFTKTTLDTEDGVPVYDVEFYTADAEYDYEINALTGAIHSRSIEKWAPGVSEPAGKDEYIGVDAAKSIAVKAANLSASDISFIKAKLEDDDGRYAYEIEFYSNAKEYEYTVDAVSGAILEQDVEARDD